MRLLEIGILIVVRKDINILKVESRNLWYVGWGIWKVGKVRVSSRRKDNS